MSLLSLHGVTLKVAQNVILDEVNWSIEPRDRIALVGRNGAGKSTLLALLQGHVVADAGKINAVSGIRIAGLTQDVPVSAEENVYHFLVHGLGELGDVLTRFHRLSQEGTDLDALAKCQIQMDALNAWDILPQVELMATRLGIDSNAHMGALSGGMKRRALLAAALIAKPDMLLLDEPTNHLDLDAIEWLEAYLKAYTGSVVLVTHDRAFLNETAKTIVELDRGHLHTYACDYETYLDRREARLLTEQKHHDLFDKRLAEEEAWIRTGIKARRTRNEGRVRALKAMREAHQARREQSQKVTQMNLDTSRSGQVVLEAKGLYFGFGEKTLVKDFSLLLTRGDKVGIIGPNGCGKTTLIRLLLKNLEPLRGSIKHGTTLDIAYFDQLRRSLNEQDTVMNSVAEGADHVVIQGKSKHVASYLKDFLFTPERFNQPVGSLSGGERNRLLLAKLFAKPMNVLVMDEPTNDLDLETMELLESILIDFKGTLLLISHDRAFINQVVTSVLVYEQEGHFAEYVGSFEDYQRQKKAPRETKAAPSAPKPKSTQKLSYNEQRELADLPKQIEALEARINAQQEAMSQADFYQQDAQTIASANQQLAKEEAHLASLYARWEALEDRS